MQVKQTGDEIIRNKKIADAVELIADAIRENRISVKDAAAQLLIIDKRFRGDGSEVDGTRVGDVHRGWLTIAVCDQTGSVTVIK